MSQRTKFVNTAIVFLMLVFPYLASGQSPVTIKKADGYILLICPDQLEQPVNRITDNAQASSAQYE